MFCFNWVVYKGTKKLLVICSNLNEVIGRTGYLYNHKIYFSTYTVNPESNIQNCRILSLYYILGKILTCKKENKNFKINILVYLIPLNTKLIWIRAVNFCGVLQVLVKF